MVVISSRSSKLSSVSGEPDATRTLLESLAPLQLGKESAGNGSMVNGEPGSLERRVYDEFLAYRKANLDLPQLRPFCAELNQKGLQIPAWKLKLIVDDIRNQMPAELKHEWRFSGKRLPVTWPQITSAYGDAQAMLKLQGVSRDPSSEEVSFFLGKKNIVISPRALEFRFEARPQAVPHSLAPYSDTTLTATKTCYRKLSVQLKRPPNIHELVDAVNKIVITQMTFEALWMRITRYNEEHPKKKIELSTTLRSGIYDSDIRNCYTSENARRERPPTFRELFAAVKAARPGAKMRPDTFHRRLAGLDLPLTHENQLKAAQQLELKLAITSLAASLRRRPLKGEVIEYLREKDSSIDQSDLTRILGTLKRRLPLEARKAYHLILPHHGYGELTTAIRNFGRKFGDLPNLQQLSRETGWTERGVLQFLPTAQTIAARHEKPPIVIRDSEFACDIAAVQTFSQAVRERVSGKSASVASDLREVSEGLKATVREWLGNGAIKANFFVRPPELSEMRLNILSIAVLYQHTAPIRLSDVALERAAMREIGWAHRHEMPTLQANTFTGTAYAIMAACLMGRLDIASAKKAFTTLDTSIKGDRSHHRLIELIDRVVRSAKI